MLSWTLFSAMLPFTSRLPSILQHNIAFHIETSHLIYTANQMDWFLYEMQHCAAEHLKTWLTVFCKIFRMWNILQNILRNNLQIRLYCIWAWLTVLKHIKDTSWVNLYKNNHYFDQKQPIYMTCEPCFSLFKGVRTNKNVQIATFFLYKCTYIVKMFHYTE